jgi:adenylate cyclase
MPGDRGDIALVDVEWRHDHRRAKQKVVIAKEGGYASMEGDAGEHRLADRRSIKLEALLCCKNRQPKERRIGGRDPDWAPAMTGRVEAIPPRLLDWLLFEVGNTSDLAGFLGAFGSALEGNGLAVWRVTFHIPTFHPEQRAFSFEWTSGGTTEVTPRAHGIEQTAAYLTSPLRAATESGKPLRRRLDAPQPDLPVLTELRAAGATDYLMVPLKLLLRTAGISFTTRRPGGFTDGNIAALETTAAAATPHISLRSIRLSAINLLNTYVGRGAGEHILAGQFRRGDGETIHAAIWYCDLRGFTRLSDALPRDELIAVLNQWFETMVRAVESETGEVLKFIGDGMLAIFPSRPDDAGACCRAALRAARRALTAMDDLNDGRRAAEKNALHFGLALHIGDVSYGNIGAPHRLDFTVIGPAVNFASRLEEQTKLTGHSLLISQEFATAAGEKLQPIGRLHLRDIAEPQEVFTIA